MVSKQGTLSFEDDISGFGRMALELATGQLVPDPQVLRSRACFDGMLHGPQVRALCSLFDMLELRWCTVQLTGLTCGPTTPGAARCPLCLATWADYKQRLHTVQEWQSCMPA